MADVSGHLFLIVFLKDKKVGFRHGIAKALSDAGRDTHVIRRLRMVLICLWRHERAAGSGNRCRSHRMATVL
ncbi:hypothetical protein WM40_00705 [Robbsia andropogonis]|uniref:Uncharacterized protein n=1 Tax=Robbsia andropogonis TaxID=28092 RepID=A0A0F5K502_9BURK|nr:hypothetical protein WM40_00705 [Robbsia andropogonis]